MSAKKTRSSVLTGVSLVAVAVLLLAGCSSQSPVEPTLSTTTETTQPQVLSRGAGLASLALGSPIAQYAEAVISAADGGRLVLYDVILDVPAGALDNDTTYSISIPDLNVFYNEFGTDGLVFKQPVTVTMSYRDADLSGIDESSIRIGWWDEEHGQWVDMNCQLDKVNRIVTGQLNHFSAYALVSD